MLSGRHVALRALHEDDEASLYDLAADLDTWEERTAAPATALTRAAYAERFRAALAGTDDQVSFGIEAAGTLVGRCGLFDISELSRNAEVGIALVPAARGRGYGTDALRVLAAFAFTRRNLHRLHLSALASNAAGLACYRKVGFVEEGRRRESAWVRGRYEDEVVMSLLDSDPA